MNKFNIVKFRLNLINKQAAPVGSIIKAGLKDTAGEIFGLGLSGLEGIAGGWSRAQKFNPFKVKDFAKGKIPSILKNISRIKGLIPPKP